MTFYHGTSEKHWQEIQKEGFLFGRRFILDSNGKQIKEVSRCTYLAVDLEEAKCYGDIILSVEYNPYKRPRRNNYIEGCWQVRVYEPIPLQNIKKIEI